MYVILNFSDDSLCSICLEAIRENEENEPLDIREMPRCGHRFHFNCIQRWLGRVGVDLTFNDTLCNETHKRKVQRFIFKVRIVALQGFSKRFSFT